VGRRAPGGPGRCFNLLHPILTAAALASFAQNQQALDDRIKEQLTGGFATRSRL